MLNHLEGNYPKEFADAETTDNEKFKQWLLEQIRHPNNDKVNAKFCLFVDPPVPANLHYSEREAVEIRKQFLIKNSLIPSDEPENKPKNKKKALVPEDKRHGSKKRKLVPDPSSTQKKQKKKENYHKDPSYNGANTNQQDGETLPRRSARIQKLTAKQ